MRLHQLRDLALIGLGRCGGEGPCNRERLAARVKAWEEGEWVREAALAHARKETLKEAA